MEIIIAIIAIILIFIVVKYLFKKLLFCLFILGFAGVVSFIYKIPYSICIFSLVILIYSINCILSELKYMGSNLIRPCKLYLNGWYEKIVAILFSINYIVFMIICYMTLMHKGIFMIDAMELGVAFCLTWICIWAVGSSRKLLFTYINRKECGI